LIANPINIRGIDHVVIRVVDLEAMIAFYVDVLGCRLERGPGELRLAQLRAGRSLIDLVDAAGPLSKPGDGPPQHSASNMDHFCLYVQPWNVGAIREHLVLHGVDVGEVADRYGAVGGGPSLYIADPEGNTVELKGPGT
jgi:catechol 2,3-dioxygenase-like lactoylglutathione lyase family enzyme